MLVARFPWWCRHGGRRATKLVGQFDSRCFLLMHCRDTAVRCNTGTQAGQVQATAVTRRIAHMGVQQWCQCLEGNDQAKEQGT